MMTGVKVFWFMMEFRFLEVLRGHLFCDRHRFKSFYWNTWLKIDKCIKLFCLEFMKKKHYSYLSVCQILVERAYYSCNEENQNLRESLWLKLLPQFSSHPNETCYIKSLWRVDVHHILVWGLTYGFQSYAPFFKLKHFHNRESLCLKLLP